MRLLHTSDWHLGRSFHGVGLAEGQAAFVDFLVSAVRTEGVDTVLVSGDVFDRALPPVDAITLASEALHRLVDAGASVVIISGNHDSARRLGFGAELLGAAGVHLRTDPRSCGTPLLLADDDGPVAVYPLPYLEPELSADQVGVDRETTRPGHEAVVTAAMTRVRADLATRDGARSVVLAHAFVAGAQVCDSERDVSVGGLSTVPLAAFAGIDYVALGHLHGRQQLTASVRYSGSPLAYSFSEEHHTKGVELVELSAAGSTTVEFLDAPVPRRVARLRGRLEELLTGEAYDTLEGCWLQVTLTDEQRPRDPMERLRRRFPHTVALAFEPAVTAPTASTYAARVAGRSDLDVALSFVQHVRARPADGAERLLLDEAFTAVRAQEALT